MKTNKNQIIDIPLEFKVACTVFKLDIQNVLQLFVDHTSVYDSLTDAYSRGFSEATRTISNYARSKVKRHKTSIAFLKCKEIAITSISAIVKQVKNPKGEAIAKRKACTFYVNALYQVMERIHTPSKIIYLDENSPINLTKDFCVLCELHNCYPKEYLEYFMSKISIAEAQASVSLNIKEQNFTYDFFLDIAKGFGRNASDVVELTDMETEFYEQMEKMRLEIYNIRDLKERTEILRDFYLSHYLRMNPDKTTDYGN
jgi:hypothetical protein